MSEEGCGEGVVGSGFLYFMDDEHVARVNEAMSSLMDMEERYEKGGLEALTTGLSVEDPVGPMPDPVPSVRAG